MFKIGRNVKIRNQFLKTINVILKIEKLTSTNGLTSNNNENFVLKLSMTRGTPSTATDLKEALYEKIPVHHDLLRRFRQLHGLDVVSHITVNDIYRGLDGVDALIRETSELDSKSGITYRGLSIPELFELLPRRGNSPSPEAVFWLLLTGDVPTHEQTESLTMDWTRRRDKRKSWWWSESSREIGGLIGGVLRALPPSVSPVGRLAIALTALDADKHYREARKSGALSYTYWEHIYEDSMELLASLPAIVALVSGGETRPTPLALERTDWADFFLECLKNAGDQVTEAQRKSLADFLRLYIAVNAGRWALKNVQRGYFLGSSQDELKCTAKAPGESEYWLVHLAARPQVNLRSAGRKRFAHLSASQDEIHVDAPVPWGEDTLFTLEFRGPADNLDARGNPEGGHYALHTCNNKYLARDGKLLETCTRDCLYAAEFHAGLLALRDISGGYLAPIGSKAVLKSRSTTVTRDELFSLEDSLPQASFVAALNQRYVSVKQGVDVTANQDEISGHETFQLEFDRTTKRWYVRTMQDRYWSLESGGGIQASEHKRSSNGLFDLLWQQDGTVALRANNGKYVATKRSGHLYANADDVNAADNDACKYYFYLMNRPVLVLRCEQGFVGAKSTASPKLECNKAGYETIRLERCERGVVRFKGQNGKYWHADSEGVTVDSDMPSCGFYLELREPSRLCIKSTDGRYLCAGKNGALRLGETDYASATKWEF